MTVSTLAELGVSDYGDPLGEAGFCRSDNALFDFSFMSRARLTGPGAIQCLHRIQSRDLSNMRCGEITVTSASLSVLCDDIIGLGFVLSPYQAGNTVTDPTGCFNNLQLVEGPLYDPAKKIPRSEWFDPD